MSHIVIIGAGTGGLPAAYELRNLLDQNKHQITLVNKCPDFQFVPSNPWLAVGWREREKISFELAPALENRGIDLLIGEVNNIDPGSKRICTTDGESLQYDYLVICSGPRLAFELIEGLGPNGGFTQSICTTAHAENCRLEVEKLIADPGPVMVGAAQGASCFGPAYEYAFILDKELKDKKIRKHVPITLVTSEPYIGHLGLGGVGDSKTLLEHELRSRDIKWICNAKIDRIESGSASIQEVDRDGAPTHKHSVPFKHAMVIPAFRGIDAVMNAPELANDKGFVLIDEHQRHPKYKNIYSAGVCVAVPPVEATPIPTGTPKTGYMIESMVTAVAENITTEIEGGEPNAKATWNAICLADMGDTGAAFVALPQIPPRNTAWFKKGRWVHAAKVAFEKYFLKKMKSGVSEPFYERMILKSLGIERLEQKRPSE